MITTGIVFLLHLYDQIFGTDMIKTKWKSTYAFCFGALFLSFAAATYFDTPEAAARRKAERNIGESVRTTQVPDAPGDQLTDTPCWKDPYCWGNKHLSVADSACDDLIEAKLEALGWKNIHWTNAWFTSIFQTFNVPEPESDDPMDRPYIRYWGNAISYSNLRGRTLQMEYTCTYDPVFNTVLSVSLG